MSVSSVNIYELLHNALPRYFRLSPKSCDNFQVPSEVITALSSTLGDGLVYEVLWMPGFVAVPGYLPMSAVNTALANCQCHTFSMDLSSSIPPNLVCKDSPSSILDMCCCPGGKLLYAADLISKAGYVVGVDISERRMEICRSLVQKYLRSTADSSHIYLFCSNGITFGSANCGRLYFDSDIAREQMELHSGTRKRRNKSTRDREAKRLRDMQRTLERSQQQQQKHDSFARTTNKIKPLSPTGASADLKVTSAGSPIALENTPQPLLGSFSLDTFDAVMVDAQCTHDGSYRHLRFLEAPEPSSDQPREVYEAIDDCRSSAFPVRQIQKPFIHRYIQKEEYAGGGSDVGIPSQNTLQAASVHGEQAVINDETEGKEDSLPDRTLQGLQRGLALNGFNRLRPGGTLVYSTCSTHREQNEDIVQWLVDTVGKELVEMVPMKCLSMGNDEPISATSPSDRAYHLALDTVLNGTDEEVFSCLSDLFINQPDSFKLLGRDLCKYVAMLPGPPGRPGDFAGTAYFGRWGGMSGMFVAHIKKKA